MPAAEPSFSTIRDEIDAALATSVRELIISVQQETAVSYVTESVVYLEKLILSGGKRIRGYGAYQMYLSAGGTDKAVALQIAVALELFHLFAIIHDDIMDEASSRRGVTTMHHYTEEWLRSHGRIGKLSRISDSQAMLWGDFLLALSQAKLQQVHISPEQKVSLNAVFSRMFLEVVVGQMIDVDMTTRRDVTEAELHEKTMLKSTLYTYVRPMQMGVAAAGAGESWMQFADVYGRSLGTAFQIQDDLFDVILTEGQMQKPVLNDIQEGAHTVLTSFILREGTAEQRELLKKFMGTKLTDAELQEARDLYRESGAITKAERDIAQAFAGARKALSSLTESERKPWEDLVTLIEQRKR
ncbi:polyprenyl synthetase family protein [soil metagenome]